MTQPVMKRRNIKNKNKSHAGTVATKIAWIFFKKKRSDNQPETHQNQRD
jgi:hypothetical protein